MRIVATCVLIWLSIILFVYIFSMRVANMELAEDSVNDVSTATTIITTTQHTITADIPENEMEKVVTARCGKTLFKMSIWPSEWISNAIVQRGCYGDAQLHRALDDMPAANGVFLDIGANIGVFTVHALARRISRIIAFEALETNCAKLRESFALNNNDHSNNIRLICRPVHTNTSAMTFTFDNMFEDGGATANHGRGTLGEPLENDRVKQHKWVEAKTVTVYPVRIDDELSSENLPTIDIIKLDIEGCECHALASADHLFSTARIGLVFTEVLPKLDQRCGCTPNALASFFSRHRFQARTAIYGGLVDPRSLNTVFDESSGDIVLTRDVDAFPWLVAAVVQ